MARQSQHSVSFQIENHKWIQNILTITAVLPVSHRCKKCLNQFPIQLWWVRAPLVRYTQFQPLATDASHHWILQVICQIKQATKFSFSNKKKKTFFGETKKAGMRN